MPFVPDALDFVDPPSTLIVPPLRCTVRHMISLCSVEVLLDLVMPLCDDPEFPLCIDVRSGTSGAASFAVSFFSFELD